MHPESRLTELLLQWETLRSQGRTIALEDLCADTPDLVDELRRRIQSLATPEDFMSAVEEFFEAQEASKTSLAA